MLNNQLFAANIREAREALRLTQTDVAARLYVTPQTVSKWENGVASPDLSNLCSLADILSTTPDRLLGISARGEDGVMIGIDGGGTKTDFVLFRGDGTVMRRLILGGSNPNVYGIEEAQKTLKQGIDSLLVAGSNVSAIFAGIAGGGTGRNREKLTSFLKKQYPRVRLSVASDIQNIVASVRGVDKCTAVICGTGLGMFADDGNGLHRVGSYGYLFDGAGSGYDVGRDALRLCLEYDDGLCEDSLTVQLAKKQLGTDVTFDKLDVLYSGGKEIIASFAPVVFEAYRQGDEAAARILERNFSYVATMIRHTQFRYDCGDKIILAGGLTHDPELLRQFLLPKLGEDAELIFPTLPPVYGACVCSARLCGGVSSPETFENHFLQTLQNG